MRSNTIKSFFVTATDTDVGKTTVTKALIRLLQGAGHKAIGCKPIACGVNEFGHNEDVLVYEQINSINLSRNLLNPICLSLPVSPDIAAHKENQIINVTSLITQLEPLRHAPVDYIFYEGLGGLKVPLNKQETLIDFVRGLQVPILFVIGLRVGCLNHALLTWDAISKEEIPVAGWIGNVIDPLIPALEDHLETLQHWISAPYLGCFSYQENKNSVNNDFDINRLINPWHSNTNL